MDPADRDAEFLTGLIMARTFTGTLSVTDSNSAVRTVILGALACNVAWGLVDAVMYLLARLSDQGQSLLALHEVRTAKSMDVARPILKEALPASVVAVLEPQEIDALAARIARLPPRASHATLERRDYLAAIAVLAAVVRQPCPWCCHWHSFTIASLPSGSRTRRPSQCSPFWPISRQVDRQRSAANRTCDGGNRRCTRRDHDCAGRLNGSSRQAGRRAIHVSLKKSYPASQF